MKQLFLSTFAKNLEYSRKNHCYLYRWAIEDLEHMTEKLQAAIVDGTFDKESISIKKTCKDLKIKHTYKAIKEYLNK